VPFLIIRNFWFFTNQTLDLEDFLIKIYLISSKLQKMKFIKMFNHEIGMNLNLILSITKYESGRGSNLNFSMLNYYNFIKVYVLFN